ncbi:hypothetical protein Bbelb_255660 [Branchiostoma belcheri]|nr:hypothetical protein Bbelb_255660 [Branchiostoma belcheri]
MAINTLRGPQPTETVNSRIFFTKKRKPLKNIIITDRKNKVWKSVSHEVFDLETRQNAVSQGAGDTIGAIQTEYEVLTVFRCPEDRRQNITVEVRSREHSSFVAKDWGGFGPCFGRIKFFDLGHGMLEPPGRLQPYTI